MGKEGQEGAKYLNKWMLSQNPLPTPLARTFYKREFTLSGNNLRPMTLVISRGSSHFSWDGSNSFHSGASFACSALSVCWISSRKDCQVGSWMLYHRDFQWGNKIPSKTPDLRSVPKESWHLRTVWPCCLLVFYKWLTERWPKPACCSSVSLQPRGSYRLTRRRIKWLQSE